jgi:hypothetical protein
MPEPAGATEAKDRKYLHEVFVLNVTVGTLSSAGTSTNHLQ